MTLFMFTDFGVEGPYVGQMEAAIDQVNREIKIIHLLHNAPFANPEASSYLLAALAGQLPGDCIVLAVVDPGVGGERAALVLEADGRFFVGPDNGLLNTIALHSKVTQWFEIDWAPDNCSKSFHGRDLFAPMAAWLYSGLADDKLKPYQARGLSSWPLDLDQIIYFDHYGNAMSGIRYCKRFDGQALKINGHVLTQADTFSSVSKGECFWYENSAGLIEIAANQENAKQLLDLAVGDAVAWSRDDS